MDNLKIKDFAIEERPREKLLKYGAKNLLDKELLAILLRTGTKELNVIKLAEKILKDVGGIKNLSDTTINELIKYDGVGKVKAINLLASIEFAKRVFKQEINEKITCKSASIIANYLRYNLINLKQEIFLAIDIDSKGKIIEEREVFKGKVSSSEIHPREIYKNSIKNSASSIICVHNHPSGVATPSIKDIQSTKSLIEASNLLGIAFLDHIIIAKEGFCSILKFLKILKENNLSSEHLDVETVNYIVKKYNLIEKY